MAHTEYKLISGNNVEQLQIALASATTWKPILITSALQGSSTIFVIVLEKRAGV